MSAGTRTPRRRLLAAALYPRLGEIRRRLEERQPLWLIHEEMTREGLLKDVGYATFRKWVWRELRTTGGIDEGTREQHPGGANDQGEGSHGQGASATAPGASASESFATSRASASAPRLEHGWPQSRRGDAPEPVPTDADHERARRLLQTPQRAAGKQSKP